MAIQHRRGAYTNFDPSKMVAGEYAIVQSGDSNTTDGKAIYMAVSSGSVKRVPFADEIDNKFTSIEGELEDLVEQAEEAAQAAAELYQVYDTYNDGNVTIILGNSSS